MKARTPRAQRFWNAWIAAPEWLRLAALLTALVLVALLAGCAGPGPAVTVRVPVPVECQEAVPDRPAMPTEQFRARPPLDQFVRAAQAEIERREGYEKKLRTALQACTRPLAP